jgi:metal-responsive CopG/Arc/MetJ family transcriptional regulator
VVYLHKRKGVIFINARTTQIIPDELNQKLEELKIKLGMSRSSIINAAIEEYIRTRNVDDLEKRIVALEKEVFKKK